MQGEDSDRMSGILSKIVRMREQAQVMDDECGTATTAIKKKQDPPSRVTAELYFKQPKRYEECRICVQLSATGRNHPQPWSR